MINRQPMPDVRHNMPRQGFTCQFVIFANATETPDAPWVVASSHWTGEAASSVAKGFVRQYRGERWFLVVDRETMELLTEDEDASP